MKKSFYVFLFLFALILMVLLLFFVFVNQQIPTISKTLLISFYATQIPMFDPDSNKIVGEIQVDSPLSTIKILRYNDLIYVIAIDRIILVNPNSTIKKIVSANSTLRDALIEDGKLYTLGFIQIPEGCSGIQICRGYNFTRAHNSYITIFDPSLSELSRIEFKQHRFDGFTILNNSFFASSYYESKVYKISGDKIVNEIQLPQLSLPSQVLSFNNKIIVIGKRGIFAISSDLSKFDVLMNESVCNFYARGFIYNNKLYATCSTGNKTIVYDLTQNKIVKQISMQTPFHILGFKNRIYVSSEKKLNIIDPNKDEINATIDFYMPIIAIG